MAGRFQAPTTPTLAELAAEALAGDQDAALRLADLSKDCATAWEFVDLYVPADEAGTVLETDAWERPTLLVFDVFVDAFSKSRARALLDTLELEPVVQSNLNEGWAG
jgi:hypothetical protein